MTLGFRPYGTVLHWLFGLWLVSIGILPLSAYGSDSDTLCSQQATGAIDVKTLVEEAEATGMPPSILSRLLVEGYQSQDISGVLGRLLCVIIQAEEMGLPPGLLFTKLEEGLGKRAPLERITSVIEVKIDDMTYAQHLLSGGKEPILDDDNVTRIATAMATGLSRKKLNALFSVVYDAPVDMRVLAVELLGYGHAIGYDPVLLDQIVKAGLSYRALGDEWAFLIKVMTSARKKKISDRRVAEEATEILSRNGSLDTLIAKLGMRPKDIY